MRLSNRIGLNSHILFGLCTHSLEQSGSNCGRSRQTNIFFALMEAESLFTAASTPLLSLVDSAGSVDAQMGSIRALLHLMPVGRSTNARIAVF